MSRKKVMNYDKVKYDDKTINGMLLVLNKIYWKIPKKIANYILAEAGDLPNFNYIFCFDEEDGIIAVKKNVKDKNEMVL